MLYEHSPYVPNKLFEALERNNFYLRKNPSRGTLHVDICLQLVPPKWNLRGSLMIGVNRGWGAHLKIYIDIDSYITNTIMTLGESI